MSTGSAEEPFFRVKTSLADLTARRPLHPYTPQGGDPWLLGYREQSSGIEQKEEVRAL